MSTKRFLNLFEHCNVKCPQCTAQFDLCEQPEIAMGAVRCPKCGEVVTQEHMVAEDKSVLREAARKERTEIRVYHECPHCHKEIGEKESFCEDAEAKTDKGYLIMTHGPCGGKYWGPLRTEAEEAEFQEIMKRWSS